MTSENMLNPAPQSRPRPEWLPTLPPALHTLLEEVYATLHRGSGALPVMGIRAVIDGFILETVGDVGSFEDKLAAMERQGIIGAGDRRRLRVIIDAGSAASHQAKAFELQHIHDMLDCVEPLLRAHWVLSPRLQQLDAKIPRRPMRPRRP